MKSVRFGPQPGVERMAVGITRRRVDKKQGRPLNGSSPRGREIRKSEAGESLIAHK